MDRAPIIEPTIIHAVYCRTFRTRHVIGPFHFLSAPPLLKGYYRTPLGNNFQQMPPLRNLGWHLYPLGNPLYGKLLKQLTIQPSPLKNTM